MRVPQVFHIEDLEGFKSRAVKWASQFQHAVCLDSNGHRQAYSSFDFLVAADATEVHTSDHRDAFEKLKNFTDGDGDWCFGFLGYDLKNGLEDLHTRHGGTVIFPDLQFFRPRRLMILRGHSLELLYPESEEATAIADLETILNSADPDLMTSKLKVKSVLSASEYCQSVLEMQRRIALGDIYEANFCMEFTAYGKLDPVSAYLSLNAISQAPFAAFLKTDGKFLLCASPERYLRKEGDQLVSQPIKGTAARSNDKKIDGDNADSLSRDPKERSENIMIVDLVRNDLSRTAAQGSVRVEELCAVHTFKQVHQLISTIGSRLGANHSGIDALRTTFPMGSMTGAPKISAMQIIDALEQTRRGIYSGAVGYFTPDGDFDFNVVIRSIVYDDEAQIVSFHVGSAITHLSIPAREFDECIVKAAAMIRVLGG